MRLQRNVHFPQAVQYLVTQRNDLPPQPRPEPERSQVVEQGARPTQIISPTHESIGLAEQRHRLLLRAARVREQSPQGLFEPVAYALLDNEGQPLPQRPEKKHSIKGHKPKMM